MDPETETETETETEPEPRTPNPPGPLPRGSGGHDCHPHSLTHPPTHSLTHSLTYSLTHCGVQDPYHVGQVGMTATLALQNKTKPEANGDYFLMT